MFYISEMRTVAPDRFLKIGAATVFGVVFDRDVVEEEWYGCSDGMNTGYMKVETARIVRDFLDYAQHAPTVIEL